MRARERKSASSLQRLGARYDELISLMFLNQGYSILPCKSKGKEKEKKKAENGKRAEKGGGRETYFVNEIAEQ